MLVACDAAILIEWQEYQLLGIGAWCFIFGFIAIVFKLISSTNLSREMWASCCSAGWRAWLTVEKPFAASILQPMSPYHSRDHHLRRYASRVARPLSRLAPARPRKTESSSHSTYSTTRCIAHTHRAEKAAANFMISIRLPSFAILQIWLNTPTNAVVYIVLNFLVVPFGTNLDLQGNAISH